MHRKSRTDDNDKMMKVTVDPKSRSHMERKKKRIREKIRVGAGGTNLVKEQNQRRLLQQFILADLSPKRNRILLEEENIKIQKSKKKTIRDMI